MISGLYFDSEYYPLVPSDNIITRENVFTIIVGKNGTGKSSLLSSLVKDSLELKLKSIRGGFSFSQQREFPFSQHFSDINFDLSSVPSVIVAVSNSPFDKFQLFRERIYGYSYLGIRDLSGPIFGLSYMSKIMSSLISSVIYNSSQANVLKNVLGYLNFEEEISANFLLRANILERFIRDMQDKTRERPARFLFARRYFSLKPDKEINQILFDISQKVLSLNLPSKFQITINGNGIVSNNDGSHLWLNLLREIPFLIDSGFLSLVDIKLKPVDSYSHFSIKDASSGQQSVIMTFLGMAAEIQDNALICIDEPEICLHPEWQERYIQLLINTFSSFRNCHFVIATHSPQIISRLSPNNCFIVDMDSRNVRKADEVINHSIDFQLANVFNSPGFKNEYLSRIALNIFMKVSKNKSFDNEDLNNYRTLIKQSEFMDKKDPLKDLITAIKKLFDLHA